MIFTPTTRRLFRLAAVHAPLVLVEEVRGLSLGSKTRPLFRQITTSRGGKTWPRPFATTGRATMTPSPDAVASDAPGGDAGVVGGEGEKGLFLFDFDGVVCDSCDECTVSSLRTLRDIGVAEGLSLPDYPPPWLFERMRAVRPAIEVGWQIPVLLAAVVEQRSEEVSGGREAMSVDEVVANYEDIVATFLVKWNKSERDMIDAFGGVRDAWIADDLPSWLDINVFYPGIPDALTACLGEGILVTTKQHRFAVALVRHAGVGSEAMPDEKIYGLGMYKGKADVIADLMTSGGYAPENIYFFEDRWPTLVKCLKDKRLDGVKLHLCSWGYVTALERKLAEAEPRVEVIDLADFTRLVASA